MPKQRHRRVIMEGLIMPTKVRKRGCSSSSSSSSRIHRYRLNKRAIVVGRSRAGLGGSRSGTPAPSCGGVESPKYSLSGKSTQPVSARRLGASLWEMNEIPSPKLSERELKELRKSGSKMVFKREKMQSAWGNLSDPSHSPTVSEVDRSGIGSQRRTPSISHGLRSSELNAAVFDSISHASLMEIESRSRPPTSSGSVSGSKNRLKDVSNALTTSKELLKIINRLDQSSSMSVISALHAELERARMQVNRLIQEQRTDKTDIHNLMKCLAQEKASWKNKESRAIEAAIASIASELEVERKLRRRVEGLNKKLGKELVEMKSSFMEVVQELQSEKRAREISEQVCDELARNVDEDRAEVEKLKNESFKIQEEAEKEREMLELADKLREGRLQMKMNEAKHHFEEKTSAISKLRKQLEVFLGAKREKGGDRGACRELEEPSALSKAESLESEISPKNTSNLHKWANGKSHGDEIKSRNSISGQIPRRSTAIQRAASEGVEWLIHHRSSYHEDDKEVEEPSSLSKWSHANSNGRSHVDETKSRNSITGPIQRRSTAIQRTITEGGIHCSSHQDGFEKEAHGRSYMDAKKGLLDHVLSSPRSSVTRDCCSPSQQREREQALSSRKGKW